MQDKVPIAKFQFTVLNCCSLENTFYSVHLQSARSTRFCILTLNVCTFLSRSHYIVIFLSPRILVATLVFEKMEFCKSSTRNLKSKKRCIAIIDIEHSFEKLFANILFHLVWSILFHSAFNPLIKSAVYCFLNTRKIIEMLHLDANLLATYSRASLFIRTPVMRIYWYSTYLYTTCNIIHTR